jgi:MoxR-like ATPase
MDVPPNNGHPGAGPSPVEQILYEVKKTIVGQDALLERLLVALLSRGHVLVEGVPGLAKTLAVKALAAAIGGQFHRVQFTPDLVPADIVGTRIYHQLSGEFQVSLGPVFTNLLLADEINRAPAKVQSALLEVMQEQQVTIGRETHTVPRPFLVMATQNPLEMEGTYPLPEAQRDRFTARVSMGYPGWEAELAMLDDRATSDPLTGLAPVADAATVRDLVDAVGGLFVSEAVRRYVVALVEASRRSPHLRLGASPRAGLQLLRAARASAALSGRDHVLPDDVQALAAPVLAHRLLLTADATIGRRSAEQVVAELLSAVPVPRGR